SRFLILDFKAYNEDQFKKAVVSVLTKRENTDGDLATYIAEAVWNKLDSKDVREAVRLSRLCRDRHTVDLIVSTMQKYTNGLVYR
ncbi:MAG: hypothetical protein U9R75_00085, partial [Candidatus Thermoplasmatota archaeon]|nr:hypothetical protein [Candidatus Thermoplasmatota archaeon]